MSQLEEELEEDRQSKHHMELQDLQRHPQEIEQLAEKQLTRIAELEHICNQLKIDMELDKFKVLYKQQQYYEQQI